MITPMNTRVLVATTLAILVAACSPHGLGRLVVDGGELHPSLVTRSLDDGPSRHVSQSVLRENPQHSSDADFVRAIARSGSQGNLNSDGVRSALYALYRGEKDVGFYGLEAATVEDADRLEPMLRKIWSHNESLSRARVHRRGLVLLVVWNDGLLPEVWKAVNDTVVQRLGKP